MDKRTIEEMAIIMLNFGMETYTKEDFLSSMEIRKKCYPIFCDYAKSLVKQGYGKQKQGRWIYSNMGCVINCSNCGERLELCYPDGTEIRETAYCPFCGSKMVKSTEDKE